jgi:hypothetical protein
MFIVSFYLWNVRHIHKFTVFCFSFWREEDYAAAAESLILRKYET